MTERTYNWHSDESAHLADWAHGELNVTEHHELLVWSVRLGKHPGLRVGGSTLYPAPGEAMAAKVEVAKQAAQGHAEAIEQVIAAETARLREELATVTAERNANHVNCVRTWQAMRDERDAALAREAALKDKLLEQIARFGRVDAERVAAERVAAENRVDGMWRAIVREGVAAAKRDLEAVRLREGSTNHDRVMCAICLLDSALARLDAPAGDADRVLGPEASAEDTDQ